MGCNMKPPAHSDNRRVKEDLAQMRKQGTVIRWDDTKGFGFINSPQSSAQLFLHIRDWRGGVPPETGQPVSFEEIHVGGKGPRAMDVRPNSERAHHPAAKSAQQKAPRQATQTARPPQQRPSRDVASRNPRTSSGPAFALMLVWAGVLVAGVVLGHLSWLLLPAALVLNLVTFYVYWQDKFAATQGAWRTNEDTLHLFGLIGGWPGAWFAHQILRHKSAKQAFRQKYWRTAVLNVVALGAWVLLPGMHLSL